MSILIKGMEMPKPGQIVLVEIDENGDVFAAYDGGRTKLTQHKAVPVPQHYDLIDHNALKIAVMDCDAETRLDFLKHAMDCINKAPVVIPSDMPTYEAEGGE